MKLNNFNGREAQTMKLKKTFIDRSINNPNLGLCDGKIGVAIYLFHLNRHNNDKEAGELAFNLVEDVVNKISISMGLNHVDGLSGIGSGISYLIRNNFIEGDENELFAELDNYIFNYLYNTDHTDFSLNFGLMGIGHYFLNRIKSRTANDGNINTIQGKMRLLLILDVLMALFNLNGYTCTDAKKLSHREIVDIEYFLLCMIEHKICNELSFRIINQLRLELNQSNYDLYDKIKRTDQEKEQGDLHQCLNNITEDNSHPDDIRQKLAKLSLINSSLPSWWLLF